MKTDTTVSDNMVYPTQTTGPTFIPISPAPSHVCPSCGRCRSCGQPAPMVPAPVQPWPMTPWGQPEIIYCGSGPASSTFTGYVS